MNIKVIAVPLRRLGASNLLHNSISRQLIILQNQIYANFKYKKYNYNLNFNIKCNFKYNIFINILYNQNNLLNFNLLI